MAVNTAIPDAASGSQRSSQTRRDASTTSNGATSNPIPEGYDVRDWPLGVLEERPTNDPFCLECVDLRPSQSQVTEEFLVVLTEERRVPFVNPSRGARELHRNGAVARASDHGMLHLLE